MLRNLDSNITSGYEYFIALPDYYSSDGNMKTAVEETTSKSTFKTDLANDSGITYAISDILVIVNEQTPMIPVISEPTISLIYFLIYLYKFQKLLKMKHNLLSQ